MSDTIYVCKCGALSTEEGVNLDDWLLANAPDDHGEMVIRCPACITRYAIRKAGGHIENGVGVVDRWEYNLA